MLTIFVYFITLIKSLKEPIWVHTLPFVGFFFSQTGEEVQRVPSCVTDGYYRGRTKGRPRSLAPMLICYPWVGDRFPSSQASAVVLLLVVVTCLLTCVFGSVFSSNSTPVHHPAP